VGAESPDRMRVKENSQIGYDLDLSDNYFGLSAIEAFSSGLVFFLSFTEAMQSFSPYILLLSLVGFLQAYWHYYQSNALMEKYSSDEIRNYYNS
jgi:hypothetical protein